MKKCSYCKTIKELSNFSKCKSNKDGLNIYCRDCRKVIKSNYYNQNKQKAKDYYNRTKEARLTYQNNYWSKNPSLRSKLRNDYRVAKLSATIKSLTSSDHLELQLIYEIAQWLTQVFEEDFHVDHIVPLRHELVCGLHVPWNLQILQAKENMQKSNNFQI